MTLSSRFSVVTVILASALLATTSQAQAFLLPSGITLPQLSVGTPRNGFCAMALQEASNPLAKIGTKAYSNPISTTEIYFVASTPDTETVAVRVQEGAMGKLIATKKNSGYAFIPEINKLNGDSVDLTVMGLTIDKDGNETIRHLGRVKANLSEEISLEAAPGLRITLKKVVVSQVVNASKLKVKVSTGVLYASADKVDCCVTCGNVQACGSGVCASCGSCSDPGHAKMTCDLEP